MLVEISLSQFGRFLASPGYFWHSADWFTQIIPFWKTTRLEECMASSKGKFLPIPKAHWTSSRDTMNPPALEDSKKLEPADSACLTCNRRCARVKSYLTLCEFRWICKCFVWNAYYFMRMWMQLYDFCRGLQKAMNVPAGGADKCPVFMIW